MFISIILSILLIIEDKKLNGIISKAHFDDENVVDNFNNSKNEIKDASKHNNYETISNDEKSNLVKENKFKIDVEFNKNAKSEI
jgi:hypothetical protein